MEAQQLPLLSPPEEVGGDEREEVMVSKNTAVEIAGVIACDGGKWMMGHMQMDKEKEMLQQHAHQHYPQLPGADATDPSAPLLSADLVESNRERKMGSDDLPVLFYEAE